MFTFRPTGLFCYAVNHHAQNCGGRHADNFFRGNFFGVLRLQTQARKNFRRRRDYVADGFAADRRWIFPVARLRETFARRKIFFAVRYKFRVHVEGGTNCGGRGQLAADVSHDALGL